MKGKFTHKELILCIGILVAIIVLISLWLNPLPFQDNAVTSEPAQQIEGVLKPAARLLLEKTFVVLTKQLF